MELYASRTVPAVDVVSEHASHIAACRPALEPVRVTSTEAATGRTATLVSTDGGTVIVIGYHIDKGTNAKLYLKCVFKRPRNADMASRQTEIIKGIAPKLVKLMPQLAWLASCLLEKKE